MPIINIEQLSKSYKQHKVLDSINLSIKEGEIFGLVGHSGAGKSTLLRTINGLESFDSGNLTVCKANIKTLNRKDLRMLRKNIGMIFQNFSLVMRKTVFDNIALPLECWGYNKDSIKKRVLELLHIVGLESKADNYPANLSGGQKQRVAIARSLALNPQILLSDEATSALDPNTTLSILDLLEQINKDFNVTIVIVTHEMEVVKKICHKAAFLDAGKIVQTGDIENLFLTPNAILREFLGERENFIFQGVPMRIYFPKTIAQEPIITQMARDLQTNFAIIGGKLEEFGTEVRGTLVIDVPSESLQIVQDYLTKRKAIWELI